MATERAPSRWSIAGLCCALAFAVPLVPRFAVAATSSEHREQLGQWGARLSLQLVNRPGALLLDWCWVLSPHFLLATVAWWILREKGSALRRWSRVVGLLVAACGTALVGFFWCRPTQGMGFDFYLGEVIYPFLALPVMAALFFFGWFVALRRLRSHERSIGPS